MFKFLKKLFRKRVNDPAKMLDLRNDTINCPVCGYYCRGNGGMGCIDKPNFIKNQYLAVGDVCMFLSKLESMTINMVDVYIYDTESFVWKDCVFPKRHKGKNHFHQFCDTYEEAKEALLSYIKGQIANKDTQIEKLNCERSELSKHAARIEGE